MVRVRFAARAGRSLRSQDDWLRARNPDAADTLLSEIERALALLRDNPLMGPKVPGRRFARYLITRRFRYRVIYRAERDEVVILDILHPRQRS